MNKENRLIYFGVEKQPGAASGGKKIDIEKKQRKIDEGVAKLEAKRAARKAAAGEEPEEFGGPKNLRKLEGREEIREGYKKRGQIEGRGYTFYKKGEKEAEEENARRRVRIEAAKKAITESNIDWDQMQIDLAEEQKREGIEMEAEVKELPELEESDPEVVSDVKAILNRPMSRGKFEALKTLLNEKGGERKEVKFGNVVLRLNEKGEIVGKSSMGISICRNDDGLDRFARMNM